MLWTASGGQARRGGGVGGSPSRATAQPAACCWLQRLPELGPMVGQGSSQGPSRLAVADDAKNWAKVTAMDPGCNWSQELGRADTGHEPMCP